MKIVRRQIQNKVFRTTDKIYDDASLQNQV